MRPGPFFEPIRPAFDVLHVLGQTLDHVRLDSKRFVVTLQLDGPGLARVTVTAAHRRTRTSRHRHDLVRQQERFVDVVRDHDGRHGPIDRGA